MLNWAPHLLFAEQENWFLKKDKIKYLYTISEKFKGIGKKVFATVSDANIQYVTMHS